MKSRSLSRSSSRRQGSSTRGFGFSEAMMNASCATLNATSISGIGQFKSMTSSHSSRTMIGAKSEKSSKSLISGSSSIWNGKFNNTIILVLLKLKLLLSAKVGNSSMMCLDKTITSSNFQPRFNSTQISTISR